MNPAPSTRWSVLLVSGLLVLAGCGGTAKPSASPTTGAGTPTTPSSTPTPTPTSAVDTSIDPCLISQTDLNKILAGNWSKGRKTSSTVCFYRSGRGGIFAITNVEEPDPQRGLDDARAACDTEPRAIPSTHSFACLERTENGDVISGNLLWKNQVWLVTIVGGPGGGAHEPELKAMATILGAIPAD